MHALRSRAQTEPVWSLFQKVASELATERLSLRMYKHSATFSDCLPYYVYILFLHPLKC